MARYSGGLLTGAGSATLPIASVYAGATGAPELRELRVWNTTTTAVILELVRLTTAGTAPAVTEAAWIDRAVANVMQIVGTHTVAPTIGTRLGIFYVLGAAIGSGAMDVFEPAITIPTGTGNGIGLVPIGTGQACYVTFAGNDI